MTVSNKPRFVRIETANGESTTITSVFFHGIGFAMSFLNPSVLVPMAVMDFILHRQPMTFSATFGAMGRKQ